MESNQVLSSFSALSQKTRLDVFRLLINAGTTGLLAGELAEKLDVKQNKYWKAYSTIIMIIWIPFGLILSIIALFQIAGLFITLIGIPMALVVAKSIGTYFNPVNKKCVPQAVYEEIDKKKAQKEIDKHLGE